MDTEHDEKKAVQEGAIGLTEAQFAADTDVDLHLLRIGHDVISRQKTETFMQSWRIHWRAACWSLFISMALWMEGYDTNVVNSFFGLPQFIGALLTEAGLMTAKFGSDVNGKLAIPAVIQGDLSQISTCGQLVGLVITGLCQERFGSKKTYLGGMLLMIVTIFPAVFATNMATLMAAEFLMGVPWGMFQTLTTAYASEICPINMRGYLAAWASMGWGGGRFISTGVLRACLDYPGDSAWKTPYAVQWMWPVPLVLAIWFAPESPWWLVRKGRLEEAAVVIRKNAKPGFYGENEVEGYVEYMRHTDALDRAEHAKGSFVDMFRGTNLRRTEIQLGVWIAQIWNGNAITGLNVEFLELAGMSTTFAFNFSMIINSLSIVGVAVSWVLLSRFGRRPIYNWGIVSIIVPNLVIGILGFITRTNSVLFGIAGLMVWINFAFHFSLGPVCYTIVGELPASRLRARSIVLGRFVYVVNGIIVNEINPFITIGWQAKSGLFWAGTGILCFAWCFFRMPETGGFSFAELDILFANKVSARKFKSVKIDDQLADHELPEPVVQSSDIKNEKGQIDHIEGARTAVLEV